MSSKTRIAFSAVLLSLVTLLAGCTEFFSVFQGRAQRTGVSSRFHIWWFRIKGTSNQTQTFVDTAVFDVPARKLLFRAPGIDTREQTSTAIDASQMGRDTQAQSFSAAMDDMTRNLVTELARFEQRLKTEPQLAQVEHRSSGGGGADGWAIGCLVTTGLWRRLSELRPICHR
jgi:rhombotail lipoprotein